MTAIRSLLREYSTMRTLLNSLPAVAGAGLLGAKDLLEQGVPGGKVAVQAVEPGVEVAQATDVAIAGGCLSDRTQRVDVTGLKVRTRGTTGAIYRGVIPFIAIQAFVLALLAAWPALVTWLPGIIYP